MYIRENILAYTVHWAKGTTAQGMVMAVLDAAAAACRAAAWFLCAFFDSVCVCVCVCVCVFNFWFAFFSPLF
jgi:hypothetical protein